MKYNTKKENLSQDGATWRTNNPQYEIRIVKYFQMNGLVKKKLKKKSKNFKWVNFTDPLSE